jgi:hypothetical protein
VSIGIIVGVKIRVTPMFVFSSSFIVTPSGIRQIILGAILIGTGNVTRNVFGAVLITNPLPWGNSNVFTSLRIFFSSSIVCSAADNRFFKSFFQKIFLALRCLPAIDQTIEESSRPASKYIPAGRGLADSAAALQSLA